MNSFISETEVLSQDTHYLIVFNRKTMKMRAELLGESMDRSPEKQQHR